MLYSTATFRPGCTTIIILLLFECVGSRRARIKKPFPIVRVFVCHVGTVVTVFVFQKKLRK